MEKNDSDGMKVEKYFAPGSMYIERIDHVDNLFPGNLDLIKQITGKNSTDLLSDDDLRECINQVIGKIKKNRHWFCIIKPLMLLGQVRPNDFEGAANRIKSIYPAGLPVTIDVSDLQAMHIGSFTAPLEYWNNADGPVKRDAEFKDYHSFSRLFYGIVKQRLSF